MKTIRFAALMFMIFGFAVYVRFGPIKEVFQENPMYALVIAILASAVYRVTMVE